MRDRSQTSPQKMLLVPGRPNKQTAMLMLICMAVSYFSIFFPFTSSALRLHTLGDAH